MRSLLSRILLTYYAMAMRKIKILNLIDSNFLGGPEKYILGYAKRLNQSIRVVISTFGTGKKEFDSPLLVHARALKNIDSFVIPSANSYDPRQIIRLITLAGSAGIDVINSHGYRADLIGLTASKLLKVPIVATFHGWTGSDTKVQLFDRLDRTVLKQMNHIITVSEANKKRLQGLGIQESRITVVPNAIDPEDFFASSHFKTSEALKEELGLSGGEQICICVGRLSPEKGQEIALHAFAKAVRKVPESRLIILGNGPEEERLRQLSLDLGIAEVVFFIGFRTNVIDYLKLSDMVILTSLTEGLPTVVLEAFLCSKFVIASSVGGTPEVVRDRETGILVPPNDAESVSKAMVEYLKDRNTRERIGQNAYQSVMASHTFESHAFKMERVFQKI